ncbi:MAG TPA: outer membrane beta-barrel protein [Vicinamibacterales bacterium]|nr:outer membrane beta-barrel protein [Vicinamibacterales bacterium]
MRRHILSALIALCAVTLPVSAAAQTHNGMVQGFGGVTFGTSASASTFGGGIAVGLTDNLQIIGEGGHLGDIKPSMLDTLLDLTPVDLRLSAIYGEGGIRFIGSPHSAVRPYAEATAGVARLSTRFDGLGGRTGAIVETALGFIDSNRPMLGVGGGVMLQGGPILVDLGYRYKRIMAGDSLQSLVNGGRDFDVSQVRVGLGVRF